MDALRPKLDYKEIEAKTCLAPVFSPSNGLFCLFQYLALSALLAVLLLVYAIFKPSNVRCKIAQINFMISNCGTGNSNPSIDLFFSLDTWLNDHPAVRDAIIWEGTDRHLYHYHEWSDEQKSQLASICRNVRAGHSFGIEAAPLLDALDIEGQIYASLFEPDMAWNYYLAYIAQSIMAEVQDWFEWSLDDFSGVALGVLFDGRYMFAYAHDLHKYSIRIDYSHPDIGTCGQGTILPGDPGRMYAFLMNNNMVAATTRLTMENLLEWCRANLVHFDGDNALVNLVDYWQYGGFPPLERILAGTVRTSVPADGPQHWTAGCKCTTGFLRLMLRTANIPVKPLRLCETGGKHAAPHFLTEDLYLSHGDDVAGKFHDATPPIPIGELFTSSADFTAWFGPGVPEAKVCENVGRRPVELGLVYLPNNLLRLHCDDLSAGRDHASSRVYMVFKYVYTVAELETANLWGRMDAKIASFGGCAGIPVTPGFYGQYI